MIYKQFVGTTMVDVGIGASKIFKIKLEDTTLPPGYRDFQDHPEPHRVEVVLLDSKTVQVNNHSENVASIRPGVPFYVGPTAFQTTFVKAEVTDIKEDAGLELLILLPRLKDALKDAGYLTVQQIKDATDEELEGISGVGAASVSRIRKAVARLG